MYDDAKLTYIVIATLVVVLGGVAFFLQGNGLKAEKTETVVDNKTSQVNVVKNISTKTNTAINTKNSTSTNMITSTSTPINIPKEVKGAVISTNLGDIEVVFDETKTKTVTNFVSLAVTNFYDSVKFHRVIKGFMIQTGDPLSKDLMQKSLWGTGGPGYKFVDELTGKEKYPQGTLAMANSGPNTNGSQFFIVTASPGVDLPPSYTVFGHVVSGMDTALKIENVKTDSLDKPLEDVVIKSVILK